MKTFLFVILLSLLTSSPNLSKVGTNSVPVMKECKEANSISVNFDSPRVYVHPNYKGNNVNMWCTEPNLERHGWNDKFSSCRVPKGWTLVFYEHPGYRGSTFTVTGNVDYFSDYGWNDVVSSVRVYHNGILQQRCSWQSSRRNNRSNDPYIPDRECKLCDSRGDH